MKKRLKNKKLKRERLEKEYWERFQKALRTHYEPHIKDLIPTENRLLSCIDRGNIWHSYHPIFKFQENK